MKGTVKIPKDYNRPITYLDAKLVGEGDEEVYLYMDTLRSQLNRYGCPAEEVYPVYFHKDYKVYRMDTICEGEYYQFGGRILAETGTYENKLTSRNGCDSIEYLSLYVVDAVRTRYTPQYVCLDDGAMDILLDIAYEAPDNHYMGTLVRPDSLSRAAGFDEQYQFGADEPISIPLPEALKQTPGTYYWTFSPLSEKECMAHTDTLAIQFLLPHSAIEWRYGYIAVTNQDYNGGYSPMTYQWYCDGNMLPGETASTILMDWTRDADHLYHCVMTDEAGRTLMSCPVVYASAEEPKHDPMLLGVENVWGGHEIRGVYDILGRYVGSEVPASKGVYIIRLDNGAPAAKILVP